MSAVEIAVKKVRKLSARQARELLGWLDKRQANGKSSIRPRHRSRQSALARSKQNFKEWHDSIRGTTDWEPPRMPDDCHYRAQLPAQGPRRHCRKKG